MKPAGVISLDPDLRSSSVINFENELRKRVIGQEEAVQRITEAINIFMAELQAPNKPIANILLLGPSGVGKTLCVEAVADVLLGSPEAILKINCGEFQEKHDVSKLIGAPPGYVGHKDSIPFITQKKLDSYHTENTKLSILLLDELEKADLALNEVLLSILDKGNLRLGTGDDVDFSKTIIFMTSNIGAKEMQATIKPLGFNCKIDVVNKKIEKIATGALVKKFSPEFINRIDKTIVFNTLKDEEIRQILQIELGHIQKRINESSNAHKFVITIDKEAETHLLNQADSARYRARDIKRALEKNVVSVISSLLLSNQISVGDVVQVSTKAGSLSFSKIPCNVASLESYLEVER